VEDMDVERPDDKSVMTYISEFYHKFTSQNQKEVAARRIQKFAAYNQSVDTLENNYINNAQQLLDWISNQVQLLNDRSFPEGLDETQQLIATHKNYKVSEKPKWNETRLDNDALHSHIQARLRAGKRRVWVAPSGFTIEDVDIAWEQLGEAEKDRSKALRDHLNKHKDTLRKQFADAASDFYDFITHTKKDIAESAKQGDLHEQLNYLKAKEQEIDSDPRSDSIQQIHRVLEELGLADENPYTDFTLEELLLLLEQVKNVIKKKKQAIQGQLADTNTSNVTEDQINEFKETFKHFDKDRSNALDKLEFRACLQTLGQAYNDDAFNKLFSELAHGGDRIDIDTFVKYMISLLEDTDNAEQIKQSFKILANDRPTIGSSDLRVPPIQEENVTYLISRMKGGEGSFNYNGYTDEVFA